MTPCRHYKNIERHTVHTFVSGPNPKQWQMVHTSDLMMVIIGQITHILTIITRELIERIDLILDTHSTECT